MSRTSGRNRSESDGGGPVTLESLIELANSSLPAGADPSYAAMLKLATTVDTLVTDFNASNVSSGTSGANVRLPPGGFDFGNEDLLSAPVADDDDFFWFNSHPHHLPQKTT